MINKYKYPIKQICLILIIILIAYSLINRKKEEPAWETHHKICVDMEEEVLAGRIIRYKHHRGSFYYLTDSSCFSPQCKGFYNILEVGDSIYKPAGTFDYYIYKRAYPDSVIFMPCDFDCGIYIQSSFNEMYNTQLFYADTLIAHHQYAERVKKIDISGNITTTVLRNEFVNYSPVAEKGIRGTIRQLPLVIEPLSLEEIICSNPREAFLEICAKLMKPGAKLYINAPVENPYFRDILKGNVEIYGLEVISELEKLDHRVNMMPGSYNMYTKILVKK